MPRKNIELLIFDLGKVLIDFDFRKVIHALKTYTPKNKTAIHTFFKTTPLWDRFERGHLKPKAFFKELQTELDLRDLTYTEFEKLWNDIFTEKKDSIALLKTLKGKYQLAMLSNVNQLHWEFVKGKHSFMKWFDHPVASYAVGHRKPEPAIFHHTLKKAGIPAERALFTDDLKPHIVAAKKIGIHGIHFKNAAQLKKDLQQIL